MKGKKIKLISLILAVILVVSCVAVAGVSASAVTGSAGEVIYFDNSVTNWSTVYCYMWSDSVGNNSTWPGKPMTNVEGDIWAYTLEGNYEKVVFNEGVNKVQSDDLIYEGTGKVAKPSGTGNKFSVTWSDYSGSATVPAPNTQSTPGQSSTTPVASAGSVYCQNDAGWSTVYCYMWNSENDKNAAWPGVKMTDLGDSVWEYNYTKNYANVIFNVGSDANKTGDLNFPGNSQIYNNKTNTWEPYSSSPVKITALTTDIKSPAYTTCNIKITATAKSAEGALTYKFTVNDTVVSNGPSPSVVWTPTSAGDYTIKVDVTDTAGNTNTRSISYKIEDATYLETAFIKAFSNSLGTTVQIKKNTPITFTLDALGGVVGTNLLFYKYVITDPDGSNNTAYYTTNKTYTYTPTKLGVYTIKAFVQNSMNATINQTYKYNCVDTIDETPDTTLPPVTTPSIAPTTKPTPPPTQATQATTQSTPKPTQATQTTEKPPVPSTSPVGTKLGDVNGDGAINVNDCTQIQKHVASLTIIDTTYADTDKDGRITVKDATVIQKYICSIITSI